MERLNAHISAADRAIRETPEVLHAVRVNFPAYVLNSVINHLMSVIRLKAHIGHKGIGIERRTRFNVFLDFAVDVLTLVVGYGHRNNLAVVLTIFRLAIIATLKDSHDNGFVFGARAVNSAGLYALMHIAGLATD